MLAIEEILPQLRQTLSKERIAVLEAPPGSGKTTRVPLALLDEPWLKGQKILMLEPRRLAARGSAEFMAQQLGQVAGQTVGYNIRFERKASDQTRIEVITEGILTRRLQSDPELKGVGLVIFDEFHERNIHSDIALALTNDLRKGLREDLRMLVMSATLDMQPLVKLLGAECLSCQGRQWPIEIIYAGGEISFQPIKKMLAAIIRATQETSGDILAFLPGIYEINQLARQTALSQLDLNIYPLHGQLSSAQQQLALKKSAQRKLILATNIAETSLTIDGIATIIDSGLCRQPAFDPASGLTKLQTVRISQASSIQRAGRSGRQGPGRCYRLWSQSQQASLLPQTPAEIRNADLVPLALELAGWGVQEASQLDWLDPPSAGNLAAANKLLVQLQLKGKNGRLTPHGEAALKLPTHPRFCQMLLQAQQQHWLAEACLLTVFLSERSAGGNNQQSDLESSLQAFSRELSQAHSTQMRALMQITKIFNIGINPQARIEHRHLAELVTWAYPDRIAFSAQADGQYLLANGQRAQLATQSILRNYPWLAVTEVRQNHRGEPLIHQGVPLATDWLEEKKTTTNWQTESYWEDAAQRIQSRQVKRLGAIILQSKPHALNPEQGLAILVKMLRLEGGQRLNWTKQVQQFQQRVALMRAYADPSLPDLNQSHLLDTTERWLAPYLSGITTANQLKRIDLLPALQASLSWEQTQRLNGLCPLRIAVPSGEQVKIEYLAEGPILAIKLQQMFGQSETPRICQGKRGITLHLLSPAGRPLAVTSDLRNFWDQVYPEVCKEMKGRYPKHPWPADPWAATPTKFTKSRTKSG